MFGFDAIFGFQLLACNTIHLNKINLRRLKPFGMEDNECVLTFVYSLSCTLTLLHQLSTSISVSFFIPICARANCAVNSVGEPEYECRTEYFCFKSSEFYFSFSCIFHLILPFRSVRSFIHSLIHSSLDPLRNCDTHLL